MPTAQPNRQVHHGQRHHLLCAAQHGSAPTIAGKDVANPALMILSVAMMLHWMDDHRKMVKLAKAATAMEKAVDTMLEDPASRTRDLGGTLGCKAFAERVAATVTAMG